MEKINLNEYLAANEYPGRGIAVAKAPDGRQVFIGYFIMGRSENSRNRVFVKTDDGIRTEAFDPAKVADLAAWKAEGALSLLVKGDGIQAVYGPKADVLKSDINDIL